MACTEKQKERMRQYYREHKEKMDAQCKAAKKRNPEKYNAIARKSQHKKVIRQLQELYASENKPDKVQRAKDAKRLNNFGCTRKEIAKTLHCAETTVDNDLIILGVKRAGRGAGVSHGVPVFDFKKGNTYCYDEAKDCKYWCNRHCTKCESTIFTDVCGQRVPCEIYERRRNWRKAI